ncbi:GIY-YIG nuclease family protein [Aquimarina rhabdastrellae]
MTRPQTIQIFLPTGSPTGVKEAELTSRMLKALYFPRTIINKAEKREMIQYTGVYFLFGEDENGISMVYIGEGENCWQRIKEHQRNKEFWTDCIIVTTKTNDYNKTDAKYLEHHCLKIAEKIKRYKFDNGKGSTKPSISESREADLLDHFETIKILVSSLGFPLFENQRGSDKIIKQEKFYCKGKDAKAEALLTDEGVLVLQGSICNLKETISDDKWVVGLRTRLKEKGVLVQKENILEFAKDELFKSPSSAAVTVLGRRANGWREWKDKTGKTLDELKRN